MFFLLDDGSIRDEQRRLVYCSPDRFLAEIVEGGACFICGIQPGDADFNAEHVLPNWIIKRYGLQNDLINLPNDEGHRYTGYKIPCCKSCNSFMGDTFEVPISELFDRGYEALVEHLRQEGPLRLFTWLNLIFLKAHLRDKMLPLHLDRRRGSEALSNSYRWEELHHIHCVARSFYSHATLTPSAYGSLLVLPAQIAAPYTQFDYKDSYQAQTLLLRMGGVAVLTVLNDACAVVNAAQGLLARINAPLSPLQLREVFAHLAYINLSLEHRPEFITNAKAQTNELLITCQHPDKVSLKPYEPAALGQIMLECVQDYLDFYNLTIDRDAISQGRWTFLPSPGP